MIKITRFCTYLGHQENVSTYICTYADCTQGTRWVCVDCMAQQLHLHGKENQNHVVKIQGLKKLLFHQFKPIIKKQQQQEAGIQKCMLLLRSMLEQISKLIDTLDSYLIEVQDVEINTIYRNIMKSLNYDFLQVDNDQLTKLLKYKGQEYRIDNTYGQEVQRMISLSSELQNMVNSWQNVENTQHKYTTQFFTDYERGNAFYSAISQNEQYLAFIDKNHKLALQSLKSSELIKEVKLQTDEESDEESDKESDDPKQRLKFTDDSQYLYVSSDKELFCYESKKLERLHQFKYEEPIQDFVCMENFIILVLIDFSIMTTDLKKNKQLQKIDTNDPQIMHMEYDRINNVIICSSNENKSIKFFYKSSGQLIFQKIRANQDYIDQIQLGENNTLLTLAYRIVKLWQIDYQTNQLNLLHQMYDWSQICNATYIQNKIVAVCKEYIKIFDLQFKLIQEIQHDQGDDVIDYEDRQISQNYLVFYGDAKVSILKRQIQKTWTWLY